MSGEPGAIYVGDVVHKRARPKRHSLRYRVFSMLVDLDQLQALDRHSRLFSVNRGNVFSLWTKDFGPRDGSSIAAAMRRRAQAAGLGETISRVRMLAYPRVFGTAFNPLVVYFLDDAAGETRMLVYEVRNTFGEHHVYQAVLGEDGDASASNHAAKKAFYVSPFNGLDGDYRFSIRAPGDKVFMGIVLTTGEGPVLTAYFSGDKRPLTDWTLLKLALAYPFMGIKVLTGIHWEAMLLWLKGVPTTLNLRRRLRGQRPVQR